LANADANANAALIGENRGTTASFKNRRAGMRGPAALGFSVC
jgi:hypothetical protein